MLSKVLLLKPETVDFAILGSKSSDNLPCLIEIAVIDDQNLGIGCPRWQSDNTLHQ